jgi:hypothetical protein
VEIVRGYWIVLIGGVGHRWENPLMGWQSSGDFMQGTHMFFKSKEDAIGFAEKQGEKSWSAFNSSAATNAGCRLQLVRLGAQCSRVQVQVLCRQLLALTQEAQDYPDEIDHKIRSFCVSLGLSGKAINKYGFPIGHSLWFSLL